MIKLKDLMKQMTEYEFEILIPPMMEEMIFHFSCEVNNITTGEKNTLVYKQNSRFLKSNDLLSIPLLILLRISLPIL